MVACKPQLADVGKGAVFGNFALVEVAMIVDDRQVLYLLVKRLARGCLN